jgi:replicative DNA helicase
VPENDDIDIVPISEATTGRGELSTPYPLGFPVFDNAMKGGVREGDLIIITGISGMGKTTLMQNITVNLAKEALLPLWFSYEVLIDNLYAKFKEIETEDLPIYVPKKIVSGNTDWLAKKITMAIDKMGVKFVFIDHIDFLQPKNSNTADQRRIVLRDICQELKNIAIDKRVVIFLVAHTKKVQGREVEMQDVAESSGIYQICDFLISVNRKTEKVNQDNMIVDVMTDTSVAKILKNRLTGECAFFVFKVFNNKMIDIDDYITSKRASLNYLN